MNQDTESFFLNEKPVNALVSLRRNHGELYTLEISQKVDTTYAHTVKLMKTLEEMGLVSSRKEGRKRFYQLTEEGDKKAGLFDDVVTELSGQEELTAPA